MTPGARAALIRGTVFVAVLAASLSAGSARSARVAQQGPFTEAQAARGARLADRHCASCHDPRRGGSALPLSGDRFLQKWSTGQRTADDLFYITRTSMPFGAPNSLGAQEYVDIIAHVLRENGYAAGPAEMRPETEALKRIRLNRVDGVEAASAGRRPGTASVPGSNTDSRSATTNTTLPGGPTQAELNRADSDRANWILPNHGYSGQRFVDAVRITRDNIRSLAPVCMYQFADNTSFHTNPIIYQGVLYATTTLATVAIDATTCRLKWRHDWKLKRAQVWPQNRGVAIKDGRLVRGTTDGFLIALDALTGHMLWERAAADPAKGETFTMPPLAFEDLVIAGPAGAENGVRGWIGAFRLSDGAPVWSFNTVPAPGEAGAETWGDPGNHPVGGGAVWAPVALDVEAGRLYLPVANPAPDFFADVRAGVNLYTNSMLVLEARTGKLIWYYQAVPHDEHDWDLTQANPLFSVAVQGKRRNLVAAGGKHGLLHVLDRDTRQQLYSVPVTTRENVEAPLTVEGVRACPGVLGGMQWNGPAFNPLTGLLYVPAVDWCGTFSKAKELRFVPGQIYMGGSFAFDPVEKSRGWLTAIDAATGVVKWRFESRRPMLAAVTTTAAGLVFTGELEGDFLALDAVDGRVLYRFNTGGRLNGGLATYELDGRQYVAVAAGNATPFWRVPPASATIIVFGLPENASRFIGQGTPPQRRPS
jgi:alcohol dehydrogenase (cytochrome c)